MIRENYRSVTNLIERNLARREKAKWKVEFLLKNGFSKPIRDQRNDAGEPRRDFTPNVLSKRVPGDDIVDC